MRTLASNSQWHWRRGTVGAHAYSGGCCDYQTLQFTAAVEMTMETVFPVGMGIRLQLGMSIDRNYSYFHRKKFPQISFRFVHHRNWHNILKKDCGNILSEFLSIMKVFYSLEMPHRCVVVEILAHVACLFVWMTVDASRAGSADVCLHELWSAAFAERRRSRQPSQQDSTQNQVAC